MSINCSLLIISVLISKLSDCDLKSKSICFSKILKKLKKKSIYNEKSYLGNI